MIVGFFSIIFNRLPAAWVVPHLPAVVNCSAVAGSVWRGQCANLVVGGQPYGDLEWTLHPASLLALRVDAHAVVTRGSAQASADIQTRGGSSITLRNLKADLPLDPRVIPQVPPTVSGTLYMDLARLTLVNGLPTDIQGTIEVHDVIDRSSGGTQLGSYALNFPPGSHGLPAGTLRDLGGPLAVDGVLRLTQPPGWHVQALVTPRPTAPPDVLQALKYLPADAQGRHNFEMESRF